MVRSPAVLLSFKIVLTVVEFLLFHIKLITVLSNSVKNGVEILIGISLDM